ncbi:MAG: YqhA family protein [Candidatus Obscuribacterales bacterium]
MKSSRILEQIVFGGRFLLLPMYLGLSIALLVYSVRFIVQTAELAWHSVSYSNTEVLISVLHLLDIVMVSHLIVMIMIGGYVLFIGDFSKSASDVDHPEPSRLPQLAWLGHIDPGALKVKMSMSMLGVSSIHLLEAFVRADNASFDHLTKLIAVHLVIVVSTVAVAWVNRYAFQQGPKDH